MKSCRSSVTIQQPYIRNSKHKCSKSLVLNPRVADQVVPGREFAKSEVALIPLAFWAGDWSILPMEALLRAWSESVGAVLAGTQTFSSLI